MIALLGVVGIFSAAAAEWWCYYQLSAAPAGSYSTAITVNHGYVRYGTPAIVSVVRLLQGYVLYASFFALITAALVRQYAGKTAKP